MPATFVYMSFLEHCSFIDSWEWDLGVENLICVSFFKEIAKWFFKVAVQLCIPPNSEQKGLRFLHILANTCYYLPSILAILVGT